MSTRTVDATFVFAPGKHDSGARASAEYFADLVEKYDAAVLLTTESQAKGIANATREAVGTHHVAKRGEYLALWRKSDVDSLGPAKLHHLTATKGLPAWRNLRVLEKPLIVGDIPIDFMAGHAPSGVQKGASYRTDRPLIVRTSKDGLHAWGDLIERGKSAQIAMLDSNLDQHLASWRRYLEDAMESESVWDEPGHLPKGGSHGRRLIDTVQFRDSDDGRTHLEVLDAGIDRGPRPKGFDHNAIWVTFRITLTEGKPNMTYTRLPDNLPQILRDAGLKVTALPGWKTRGRPASTGGFDPVGVLCHHTATTVMWTIAAVLRLLTGGRTGLPGPLAQIGLSRKGHVYIVAAGRANHAGRARASGTVAAGDGNELYAGIEAFNNGVGEPWPKVQYDAYVLLAAVLSVKVTGNSAQTVRGHKETSTTGKIDPTFNMDIFRERVAAAMSALAEPAPVKPPKKRRPAPVRSIRRRIRDYLKTLKPGQKTQRGHLEDADRDLKNIKKR